MCILTGHIIVLFDKHAYGLIEALLGWHFIGHYLYYVKCSDVAYGHVSCRTYNRALWESLFDEFLNIPSCDEMPDLQFWRSRLEEDFNQKKESYSRNIEQVNKALGILFKSPRINHEG